MIRAISESPDEEYNSEVIGVFLIIGNVFFGITCILNIYFRVVLVCREKIQERKDEKLKEKEERKKENEELMKKEKNKSKNKKYDKRFIQNIIDKR